jgi:hypothetical protein
MQVSAVCGNFHGRRRLQSNYSDGFNLFAHGLKKPRRFSGHKELRTKLQKKKEETCNLKLIRFLRRARENRELRSSNEAVRTCLSIESECLSPGTALIRISITVEAVVNWLEGVCCVEDIHEPVSAKKLRAN